MERPDLRSGASSSASEEEWANDEFKAKYGKEDQEPAPKRGGAYAPPDRCSDPHTQQRGNDRECGQGNVPKVKSSATSQARRQRDCRDRERQAERLDKMIFGKAEGLEIGNGGDRKNASSSVDDPGRQPYGRR